MRRLSVLCVLAASAAAHAKSVKSVKYKFTIEAPEGWEVAHKDEDSDPVKLSLTTKDKAGNVTVMAVPVASKESAAGVLAAMDKQRKTANELAKDKLKLPKEQLARIGADDGALGRYTQAEVLQRAFVVTRERRAYLVLGAFRKSRERELGKTVDAALATFKILD
jgi:hypothetical protein